MHDHVGKSITQGQSTSYRDLTNNHTSYYGIILPPHQKRVLSYHPQHHKFLASFEGLVYTTSDNVEALESFFIKR
jgi:hypothetical protein